MSSNVSGMAAQIRAATESETFDLGGQSASTIQTMIKDAFGEPFSHLGEVGMIRITLVTGAGKLGRQKYDEGAAKAVTSVLRTLDFEEDRGASCVVECAGSFKLQHDTGKNLKTVVIFPKVLGTTTTAAETGLEAGMAGLSTTNAGGSGILSDSSSPIYKIATCSVEIFERNILLKCPTWSQKKGCLAALDDLQRELAKLNDKLMSGTPLTEEEQNVYDAMEALDEKQAFLKERMHEQVEVDQKLTVAERDMLRTQVSERLANIETQLSSDPPKKKKEKLETMKAKATQRRDLLEQLTPLSPPRLSKEPEIAKLRKELVPLAQLEESTKGRLLSIKETQTLARKDEIMSEISDLEEQSRGWFEDDAAFQLRVDASRAVTEKLLKSAAAKGKGKASSSKGGGTTTKWVTPNANAWGAKKTTKSSSKPKAGGGNVFAAMMMDSDSD